MTFEFNPDAKLKVWRSEGNHLPAALRDFHSQKALFRAIEKAYGRMRLAGQANGAESLDWVSAHCYNVDYFLWFMAAHGYTLQKSRAAQPFLSLDESVRGLAQTHSLVWAAKEDSLREDKAKAEFLVSEQSLQAHLQWCPQVWSSGPGEKTSDFRSLSIASLGLIGEAGEFVDSLNSGETIDQLKEAGDVLYYWCVLCDAFGLDAAMLARKGLVALVPGSVMSRDSQSVKHLQEELLLEATIFSEIFKKFIRDLNCEFPTDKDHPFWEKLNRFMSAFFEVYCGLLFSNNLRLPDVCSANKAKLLDRRARGVTRGDGDNR